MTSICATPDPSVAHAGIPSFAAAIDLHRRYAGLVHLDLKVSGTDEEVVAMLDVLDMWSHVTEVNDNGGNAAAVRAHPEYATHAMGGMIGLTDRRGDFDLARLQDAADRVGARGGLFVDDPRLALTALGREIGEVSAEPVLAEAWDPAPIPARAEAELLAVLTDADDGDDVPVGADAEAAKAERVPARFDAALAVAEQGLRSPELYAALESLARHRSLHPDWRHHGVDGAEAVTSILRLGDPDGCGTTGAPSCAIEVARAVLEDEGDDLHALDGTGEFPVSDWRIKSAAVRALPELGTPEALALALQILAWSDDELSRRGPITLEEVAAAAIAMLPAAATDDAEATATATGLLTDPRPGVAGRAAWALWSRVVEPWARAAVGAGAPHLLHL